MSDTTEQGPTVKIQNLYPGIYAVHNGTGTRVVEYPLDTEQGVYVNLSSGEQIGPLPLDTMIEVVDFTDEWDN